MTCTCTVYTPPSLAPIAVRLLVEMCCPIQEKYCRQHGYGGAGDALDVNVKVNEAALSKGVEVSQTRISLGHLCCL